MDNTIRLEKNRLMASIVVLFYFCFLFLINYFKVQAQIVRVIVELLTIPALFALLGIPVWAMIDNFKNKNNKQSVYIFTLLVSLATMIMLLILNSYFN